MNAPLQFFGQPTTKNDHSQLHQFFLPLFGFTKVYTNLRVHSIHLTHTILQFQKNMTFIKFCFGSESDKGSVSYLSV